MAETSITIPGTKTKIPRKTALAVGAVAAGGVLAFVLFRKGSGSTPPADSITAPSPDVTPAPGGTPTTEDYASLIAAQTQALKGPLEEMAARLAALQTTQPTLPDMSGLVFSDVTAPTPDLYVPPDQTTLADTPYAPPVAPFFYFSSTFQNKDKTGLTPIAAPIPARYLVAKPSSPSSVPNLPRVEPRVTQSSSKQLPGSSIKLLKEVPRVSKPTPTTKQLVGDVRKLKEVSLAKVTSTQLRGDVRLLK